MSYNEIVQWAQKLMKSKLYNMKRTILILALLVLSFNQKTGQGEQKAQGLSPASLKTQSSAQQSQPLDSETIEPTSAEEETYQNKSIVFKDDKKTVITICAAIVALSVFIFKRLCCSSKVVSEPKDASPQPEIVSKEVTVPDWYTSQFDESPSLNSTIENIKAKYLIDPSQYQNSIISQSQGVQIKTS